MKRLHHLRDGFGGALAVAPGWGSGKAAPILHHRRVGNEAGVGFTLLACIACC